ncbi:MAG TPA: hypothetical protein VH763_15740 [Gemmatimonadales bacterium]|jgi:hypothetical protein
MKSLGLVLGLLILLPRVGAAQQSACSLLTAAEIQAATGTKPSEPHPMDTDVPGKKGERVLACLWSVPAHQGQVALSLGHLPPNMSAADAARQNPGIDALRKAHYKEESRAFSDAWCSILTPPAGEKQGTILSSCAGGVKGKILSVAFTSPTKALTIAQAKTLLDKAAARRQ